MLPTCPIPPLQLKMHCLLCATTKPMPHMAIPGFFKLLVNGRQPNAWRQGPMMSWNPIWRRCLRPQKMSLPGGAWVYIISTVGVWCWHVVETLYTVSCSHTNGKRLSAYSRLSYTIWMCILKCVSHRWQAVQLAGTRHVWGIANFEECLSVRTKLKMRIEVNERVTAILENL